MQLDPRHLVQFATIIEEKSFSTAAKRLGTTQPALSNMVKALEVRIGLKLLSQRRRPVIPTQIGNELAIKGLGIRSLMEEVDRETDDFRKGQKGTLRVAAPSFFCESVLADLIASFREEHPQTGFDIYTAYGPELYQMVERRKVDMGFGPVDLDTGHSNTQSLYIVSFRHAIICRAQNPLLTKGRLVAADLEAANWLSHSSESVLFQLMRSEMFRHGVTSLDNALKSNSSSALMQLLKNTDCLSVLPLFAVLGSISKGDMAIVDFPNALPDVPFGLITQPHFSPTPLENNFISHVEKNLKVISQKEQAFRL